VKVAVAGFNCYDASHCEQLAVFQAILTSLYFLIIELSMKNRRVEA